MASLPVLPAAADDLTQIVALEEQCFSLPHTLDQLRYELEDAHILDEGYISNVAVAEKARRQGIADTLLARLDTAAAEYRLSFISLEVRESNLPAIRLYEKNGYEKTGMIPNCYTLPKENALVMTKTYH